MAMQGLDLAQRHNLTGISVEIATTLTSLDETLDLDRLRTTWLDTADRARAAGHVDAELRALYFLGRLHHDLGDFDGALEAYGRVVSRGEEEGLAWAPFPAESRQMVASVLVAQGRLKEAYDRLDVSGLNPPVVYEWLYYALQMQVQVLRGHTKQDAFTALRAYWPTDGLTAITAATAELTRAEQEGDAAHGVEVYDLVVETVRPIWHEWFQARLRLSTVVVGMLATSAAHQSAAEREAAADVVRRMLDDGERVIDFYAEFEISRGPEYHAWVARRTAEGLRWRWLSQLDPPDAADLAAAWRTAEEAFVAFGHVPELARTRARLAEVLRATGDPAGARECRRPGARDGPPARAAAAPRRADRPRLEPGAPHGHHDDAHPAGDRDPRPGRRGPHQRRDRQAALHRHQDGVGPRLQHPGQARRGLPHRGGGDRAAQRAALTGPSAGRGCGRDRGCTAD